MSSTIRLGDKTRTGGLPAEAHLVGELVFL